LFRQALLYIGGVVLAAVAYARIQSRQAAAAAAGKGDPPSEPNPFGEIRLLTPVNIDTRAVETGLLACDCGMVMGG